MVGSATWSNLGMQRVAHGLSAVKFAALGGGSAQGNGWWEIWSGALVRQKVLCHVLQS